MQTGPCGQQQTNSGVHRGLDGTDFDVHNCHNNVIPSNPDGARNKRERANVFSFSKLVSQHREVSGDRFRIIRAPLTTGDPQVSSSQLDGLRQAEGRL